MSSIRRPVGAALLFVLAFGAAVSVGASEQPPTFGLFQLDSSFGHRGRLLTPGPPLFTTPSAAADASGRIVVAAPAQPNRIELVRYRRDGLGRGHLDPSFGSSGRVVTRVDIPRSENFGNVDAMALDRDGRIVVAGDVPPVEGGYHGGFVARFLSDGVLDSSFGNGGVVTALPHGGFNTVSIDRSGRILAAGFSHSTFLPQLAVVRFHDSGSPDKAFGDGGTAIPHWSGVSESVANGVALDSRGRIVVVGMHRSSEGHHPPSHFAIVRLRADGSLDPTFGAHHGWVARAIGGRSTFGTSASSVAIAPDGRVVVAGDAFFDHRSEFAVLRCRADGRSDATFGRRGVAHTSFGGPGSTSPDVAVGVDGRITVTGTSSFHPHSTISSGFAIARYMPSGSPLRGFGVDGQARTRIGREADAGSLIPQGHHRALVVGTAIGTPADSRTLALARYIARPLYR
jgi:uncharacterized delta-60 repeat protein